MKNKLKKFGIIAGIAATCLLGKGVYQENFSDEIKNLADLIRIVKEEEPRVRRNNLPKHIYWKTGETPWGTAASGKISEGNYMVILDGKRNRSVVRHELYHIYGNHCDKAFAKGEWASIDKILDEITANCYDYYGLRL